MRALDLTLVGVGDRAEALREWIGNGDCLVTRVDGELVEFAIANRSFFAKCFIVLLVVHAAHRRRGVASALIRAMQSLCDRLGFVRSGIVENVDDDDPEIIYFKRLR